VLLVCWGYFIDETEATHSSESGGTSSLLSHRVGQVDVVELWAWPPLALNRALRSLDSEEVKAPSPLCTISDLGSE
jgi:hypothetical protein